MSDVEIVEIQERMIGILEDHRESLKSIHRKFFVLWLVVILQAVTIFKLMLDVKYGG